MQSFRLLYALGLLIGLTGLVHAQSVAVPVDTEQSTMAYTGHHWLHDWTGTSNALEGMLALNLSDPSQSRVEIQAPVESFDSGNGNRDADMLDVVEADQYPTVHFVSEHISADAWTETDQGWQGSWTVQGQLTFHGQTHPLTIPVDVQVNGSVFEAHGTFEVSLERYDVDRPRLLFMPIGRTIDIEATIRATLSTAGTR